VHYAFLKSAENSALFDTHHEGGGGCWENFFYPSSELSSIFAGARRRAQSIKKNIFGVFACFIKKNYCRLLGPNKNFIIKNQLTLMFTLCSVYFMYSYLQYLEWLPCTTIYVRLSHTDNTLYNLEKVLYMSTDVHGKEYFATIVAPQYLHMVSTKNYLFNLSSIKTDKQATVDWAFLLSPPYVLVKRSGCISRGSTIVASVPWLECQLIYTVQ
jgi:hypothetical protein